MRKNFLKITSFFLVVCLPLGDVSLYAQIEKGISPDLASINTGARQELVRRLGWESRWGRIEEVHQGTSGKTMYFIQDAHVSLDAQKNIARIIRHLVNREKVRTVYEEGYEGDVPTRAYFDFIQDAEEKRKTADYLLDRLRIGGAEYAHVQMPEAFQLTGAESRAAYAENLKRYRLHAEKQKQNERELEELSREIRALGNRFWTDAAKAWVKLSEQYLRREIPLPDYLRRMKRFMSASDLEDLPQIALIQSGTFTGTEPRTLFEEMETLDERIAARLFAAGRERIIRNLHKQVLLLKNLNRLELSEAEFQILKTAMSAVKTEAVARLITQETRKSVVLHKHWEAGIQNAVAFYEAARERDLAVTQTLRAKFLSGAEDHAVLVFGGFHKNAILDFLKSQNCSYVVISPAMGEIKSRHERYYGELMGKGYLPFEAGLAGEAARQPSVYLAPFGQHQIIQIHAGIRHFGPLPAPILYRRLDQWLRNNAKRSELRAAIPLTIDSKIQPALRQAIEKEYGPGEWLHQSEGFRSAEIRMAPQGKPASIVITDKGLTIFITASKPANVTDQIRQLLRRNGVTFVPGRVWAKEQAPVFVQTGGASERGSLKTILDSARNILERRESSRAASLLHETPELQEIEIGGADTPIPQKISFVKSAWNQIPAAVQRQILNASSWKTVPDPAMINGRILRVVFSQTVVIDGQSYEALEIKGGGFTSKDGKAQMPAMVAYGGRGFRLIKELVDRWGRMVPALTDLIPQGGMLLNYAVREWSEQYAAYRAGLSRVLPLGYRENTGHAFEFHGHSTGAYFRLIPSQNMPRMSDLVNGKNLSAGELYELGQLYGRLLRLYHDRGILFGMPYPDNVLMDASTFEFTDYETARRKEGLEKRHAVMLQFLDLETAVQRFVFDIAKNPMDGEEKSMAEYGVIRGYFYDRREPEVPFTDMNTLNRLMQHARREPLEALKDHRLIQAMADLNGFSTETTAADVPEPLPAVIEIPKEHYEKHMERRSRPDQPSDLTGFDLIVLAEKAGDGLRLSKLPVSEIRRLAGNPEMRIFYSKEALSAQDLAGMNMEGLFRSVFSPLVAGLIESAARLVPQAGRVQAQIANAAAIYVLHRDHPKAHFFEQKIREREFRWAALMRENMPQRSELRLSAKTLSGAEMARILNRKAETVNAIKIFRDALLAIYGAEALGDELVKMRSEKILEVGPGKDLRVLRFLIRELKFDPKNLYALDVYLGKNRRDLGFREGRYIEGSIEKIPAAWRDLRFDRIMAFYVMGADFTINMKKAADSMKRMLAPDGSALLSHRTQMSDAAIYSALGRPYFTQGEYELFYPNRSELRAGVTPEISRKALGEILRPLEKFTPSAARGNFFENLDRLIDGAHDAFGLTQQDLANYVSPHLRKAHSGMITHWRQLQRISYENALRTADYFLSFAYPDASSVERLAIMAGDKALSEEHLIDMFPRIAGRKKSADSGSLMREPRPSRAERKARPEKMKIPGRLEMWIRPLVNGLHPKINFLLNLERVMREKNMTQQEVADAAAPHIVRERGLGHAGMVTHWFQTQTISWDYAVRAARAVIGKDTPELNPVQRVMKLAGILGVSEAVFEDAFRARMKFGFDFLSMQALLEEVIQPMPDWFDQDNITSADAAALRQHFLTNASRVRRWLGIRPVDVAALLDIYPGTVSYWETGRMAGSTTYEAPTISRSLAYGYSEILLRNSGSFQNNAARTAKLLGAPGLSEEALLKIFPEEGSQPKFLSRSELRAKTFFDLKISGGLRLKSGKERADLDAAFDELQKRKAELAVPAEDFMPGELRAVITAFFQSPDGILEVFKNSASWVQALEALRAKLPPRAPAFQGQSAWILPAASSVRDLKVLVIEDLPGARDKYDQYLAARGITSGHILKVASASEARQVIQEGYIPHIIFLDDDLGNDPQGRKKESGLDFMMSFLPAKANRKMVIVYASANRWEQAQERADFFGPDKAESSQLDQYIQEALKRNGPSRSELRAREDRRIRRERERREAKQNQKPEPQLVYPARKNGMSRRTVLGMGSLATAGAIAAVWFGYFRKPEAQNAAVRSDAGSAAVQEIPVGREIPWNRFLTEQDTLPHATHNLRLVIDWLIARNHPKKDLLKSYRADLAAARQVDPRRVNTVLSKTIEDGRLVISVNPAIINSILRALDDAERPEDLFYELLGAFVIREAEGRSLMLAFHRLFEAERLKMREEGRVSSLRVFGTETPAIELGSEQAEQYLIDIEDMINRMTALESAKEFHETLEHRQALIWGASPEADGIYTLERAEAAMRRIQISSPRAFEFLTIIREISKRYDNAAGSRETLLAQVLKEHVAKVFQEFKQGYARNFTYYLFGVKQLVRSKRGLEGGFPPSQWQEIMQSDFYGESIDFTPSAKLLLPYMDEYFARWAADKNAQTPASARSELRTEGITGAGHDGRSAIERERIDASFAALARMTREAKTLFVMPMFKEMGRLNPKSDQNPVGEDALRVKVAQFEALRAANPLFAWRILAVDDGTPGLESAAEVERIWREIQAEYSARGIYLNPDQVRTTAVTEEEKKRSGSRKGYAVVKAMQQAVDEGWADYVGYTDTDISTNLEQTPLLLDELMNGGADAAIGSRWAAGGEAEVALKSRARSSHIYNLVVKGLVPPLYGILDTQRGFKLFSRELASIILKYARDPGMSFDTELLLLTRLAGGRIREVAISWFDSAEASTVNLSIEAKRMLKGIIRYQTPRVFNLALQYRLRREFRGVGPSGARPAPIAKSIGSRPGTSGTVPPGTDPGKRSEMRMKTAAETELAAAHAREEFARGAVEIRLLTEAFVRKPVTAILETPFPSNLWKRIPSKINVNARRAIHEVLRGDFNQAVRDKLHEKLQAGKIRILHVPPQLAKRFITEHTPLRQIAWVDAEGRYNIAGKFFEYLETLKLRDPEQAERLYAALLARLAAIDILQTAVSQAGVKKTPRENRALAKIISLIEQTLAGASVTQPQASSLEDFSKLFVYQFSLEGKPALKRVKPFIKSAPGRDELLLENLDRKLRDLSGAYRQNREYAGRAGHESDTLRLIREKQIARFAAVRELFEKENFEDLSERVRARIRNTPDVKKLYERIERYSKEYIRIQRRFEKLGASGGTMAQRNRLNRYAREMLARLLLLEFHPLWIEKLMKDPAVVPASERFSKFDRRMEALRFHLAAYGSELQWNRIREAGRQAVSKFIYEENARGEVVSEIGRQILNPDFFISEDTPDTLRPSFITRAGEVRDGGNWKHFQAGVRTLLRTDSEARRGDLQMRRAGYRHREIFAKANLEKIFRPLWEPSVARLPDLAAFKQYVVETLQEQGFAEGADAQSLRLDQLIGILTSEAAEKEGLTSFLLGTIENYLEEKVTDLNVLEALRSDFQAYGDPEIADVVQTVVTPRYKGVFDLLRVHNHTLYSYAQANLTAHELLGYLEDVLARKRRIETIRANSLIETFEEARRRVFLDFREIIEWSQAGQKWSRTRVAKLNGNALSAAAIAYAFKEEAIFKQALEEVRDQIHEYIQENERISAYVALMALGIRDLIRTPAMTLLRGARISEASRDIERLREEFIPARFTDPGYQRARRRFRESLQGLQEYDGRRLRSGADTAENNQMRRRFFDYAVELELLIYDVIHKYTEDKDFSELEAGFRKEIETRLFGGAVPEREAGLTKAELTQVYRRLAHTARRSELRQEARKSAVTETSVTVRSELRSEDPPAEAELKNGTLAKALEAFRRATGLDVPADVFAKGFSASLGAIGLGGVIAQRTRQEQAELLMEPGYLPEAHKKWLRGEEGEPSEILFVAADETQKPAYVLKAARRRNFMFDAYGHDAVALIPFTDPETQTLGYQIYKADPSTLVSGLLRSDKAGQPAAELPSGAAPHKLPSIQEFLASGPAFLRTVIVKDGGQFLWKQREIKTQTEWTETAQDGDEEESGAADSLAFIKGKTFERLALILYHALYGTSLHYQQVMETDPFLGTFVEPDFVITRNGKKQMIDAKLGRGTRFIRETVIKYQLAKEEARNSLSADEPIGILVLEKQGSLAAEPDLKIPGYVQGRHYQFYYLEDLIREVEQKIPAGARIGGEGGLTLDEIRGKIEWLRKNNLTREELTEERDRLKDLSKRMEVTENGGEKIRREESLERLASLGEQRPADLLSLLETSYLRVMSYGAFPLFSKKHLAELKNNLAALLPRLERLLTAEDWVQAHESDQGKIQDSIRLIREMIIEIARRVPASGQVTVAAVSRSVPAETHQREKPAAPLTEPVTAPKLSDDAPEVPAMEQRVSLPIAGEDSGAQTAQVRDERVFLGTPGEAVDQLLTALTGVPVQLFSPPAPAPIAPQAVPAVTAKMMNAGDVRAFWTRVQQTILPDDPDFLKLEAELQKIETLGYSHSDVVELLLDGESTVRRFFDYFTALQPDGSTDAFWNLEQAFEDARDFLQTFTDKEISEPEALRLFREFVFTGENPLIRFEAAGVLLHTGLIQGIAASSAEALLQHVKINIWNVTSATPEDAPERAMRELEKISPRVLYLIGALLRFPEARIRKDGRIAWIGERQPSQGTKAGVIKHLENMNRAEWLPFVEQPEFLYAMAQGYLAAQSPELAQDVFHFGMRMKARLVQDNKAAAADVLEKQTAAMALLVYELGKREQSANSSEPKLWEQHELVVQAVSAAVLHLMETGEVNPNLEKLQGDPATRPMVLAMIMKNLLNGLKTLDAGIVYQRESIHLSHYLSAQTYTLQDMAVLMPLFRDYQQMNPTSLAVHAGVLTHWMQQVILGFNRETFDGFIRMIGSSAWQDHGGPVFWFVTSLLDGIVGKEALLKMFGGQTVGYEEVSSAGENYGQVTARLSLEILDRLLELLWSEDPVLSRSAELILGTFVSAAGQNSRMMSIDSAQDAVYQIQFGILSHYLGHPQDRFKLPKTPICEIYPANFEEKMADFLAVKLKIMDGPVLLQGLKEFAYRILPSGETRNRFLANVVLPLHERLTVESEKEFRRAFEDYASAGDLRAASLKHQMISGMFARKMDENGKGKKRQGKNGEPRDDLDRVVLAALKTSYAADWERRAVLDEALNTALYEARQTRSELRSKMDNARRIIELAASGESDLNYAAWRLRGSLKGGYGEDIFPAKSISYIRDWPKPVFAQNLESFLEEKMTGEDSEVVRRLILKMFTAPEIEAAPMDRLIGMLLEGMNLFLPVESAVSLQDVFETMFAAGLNADPRTAVFRETKTRVMLFGPDHPKHAEVFSSGSADVLTLIEGRLKPILKRWLSRSEKMRAGAALRLVPQTLEQAKDLETLGFQPLWEYWGELAADEITNKWNSETPVTIERINGHSGIRIELAEGLSVAGFEKLRVLHLVDSKGLGLGNLIQHDHEFAKMYRSNALTSGGLSQGELLHLMMMLRQGVLKIEEFNSWGLISEEKVQEVLQNADLGELNGFLISENRIGVIQQGNALTAQEEQKRAFRKSMMRVALEEVRQMKSRLHLAAASLGVVSTMPELAMLENVFADNIVRVIFEKMRDEDWEQAKIAARIEQMVAEMEEKFLTVIRQRSAESRVFVENIVSGPAQDAAHANRALDILADDRSKTALEIPEAFLKRLNVRIREMNKIHEQVVTGISSAEHQARARTVHDRKWEHLNELMRRGIRTSYDASNVMQAALDYARWSENKEQPDTPLFDFKIGISAEAVKALEKLIQVIHNDFLSQVVRQESRFTNIGVYNAQGAEQRHLRLIYMEDDQGKVYRFQTNTDDIRAVAEDGSVLEFLIARDVVTSLKPGWKLYVIPVEAYVARWPHLNSEMIGELHLRATEKKRVSAASSEGPDQEMIFEYVDLKRARQVLDAYWNIPLDAAASSRIRSDASVLQSGHQNLPKAVRDALQVSAQQHERKYLELLAEIASGTGPVTMGQLVNVWFLYVRLSDGMNQYVQSSKPGNPEILRLLDYLQTATSRFRHMAAVLESFPSFSKSSEQNDPGFGPAGKMVIAAVEDAEGELYALVPDSSGAGRHRFRSVTEPRHELVADSMEDIADLLYQGYRAYTVPATSNVESLTPAVVRSVTPYPEHLSRKTGFWDLDYPKLDPALGATIGPGIHILENFLHDELNDSRSRGRKLNDFMELFPRLQKRAPAVYAEKIKGRERELAQNLQEVYRSASPDDPFRLMIFHSRNEVEKDPKTMRAKLLNYSRFAAISLLDKKDQQLFMQYYNQISDSLPGHKPTGEEIFERLFQIRNFPEQARMDKILPAIEVNTQKILAYIYGNFDMEADLDGLREPEYLIDPVMGIRIDENAPYYIVEDAVANHAGLLRLTPEGALESESAMEFLGRIKEESPVLYERMGKTHAELTALARSFTQVKWIRLSLLTSSEKDLERKLRFMLNSITVQRNYPSERAEINAMVEAGRLRTQKEAEKSGDPWKTDVFENLDAGAETPRQRALAARIRAEITAIVDQQITDLRYRFEIRFGKIKNAAARKAIETEASGIQSANPQFRLQAVGEDSQVNLEESLKAYTAQIETIPAPLDTIHRALAVLGRMPASSQQADEDIKADLRSFKPHLEYFWNLFTHKKPLSRSTETNQQLLNYLEQARSLAHQNELRFDELLRLHDAIRSFFGILEGLVEDQMFKNHWANQSGFKINYRKLVEKFNERRIGGINPRDLYTGGEKAAYFILAFVDAQGRIYVYDRSKDHFIAEEAGVPPLVIAPTFNAMLDYVIKEGGKILVWPKGSWVHDVKPETWRLVVKKSEPAAASPIAGPDIEELIDEEIADTEMIRRMNDLFLHTPTENTPESVRAHVRAIREAIEAIPVLAGAKMENVIPALETVLPELEVQAGLGSFEYHHLRRLYIHLGDVIGRAVKIHNEDRTLRDQVAGQLNRAIDQLKAIYRSAVPMFGQNLIGEEDASAQMIALIGSDGKIYWGLRQNNPEVNIYKEEGGGERIISYPMKSMPEAAIRDGWRVVLMAYGRKLEKRGAEGMNMLNADSVTIFAPKGSGGQGLESLGLWISDRVLMVRESLFPIFQKLKTAASTDASAAELNQGLAEWLAELQAADPEIYKQISKRRKDLAKLLQVRIFMPHTPESGKSLNYHLRLAASYVAISELPTGESSLLESNDETGRAPIVAKVEMRTAEIMTGLEQRYQTAFSDARSELRLQESESRVQIDVPVVLANPVSTPVRLFIPYQDLKNSPRLRDELFALSYESRSGSIKAVIYGADLTDESLAPFRELSLAVVAAGFDEAYRLYGEKDKGRNLLIAQDVRLLKGTPIKNNLNAFLYRSPGDAYAALLYTLSDEQLGGVEKSPQGYYQIIDSQLRAIALEHQASLVISMSA